MSFWGPQCCETNSNAKKREEEGPLGGLFDFFAKCVSPEANSRGNGHMSSAYMNGNGSTVRSVGAFSQAEAPMEFSLDDNSLELLFRRADMNKTGYIERDEGRIMFQELLRHIDPSYRVTPQDMEDMFNFFDQDGDGRIDRVDHRQSMRELLTKYKFGEQALIIVDLQNDFVCGSLKVEGGLDAVRNTNSIRRKFKHVFLTRDWHPRNHCSFHENNPGTQLFQNINLTLPDGEVVDQVMWPTHCVQHTSGADFHPDLVTAKTDIVLDKGLNSAVDSYSGFFDNSHGINPKTGRRSGDTGLCEILRQHNVNEVYCVGLAYDYCVGFTAQDAAECGFRSYLIEDCARAVQPGSKMQMRRQLMEKGVKLIHSSMAPMPRPQPNGAFTMEAVRRAVQSRSAL
mmetsp:Transcript_12521/g.29595  ORF Transcript_12521/g.29595 Transcript_12521/m.29595 type:complete len:398 (-) Transcript_12521:351-1544(-)